MTAELEIAGRKVGPSHPTYIIAELSANHHHDLDKARRLVEAAAEAGADAIKLQTYTADTITIDCDNEHFRIAQGTLWDGRVLYDLYREAFTPWEWHAELASLAKSLGVHCFSSPFDPTAVDFLESLDVPAYKLASFELVDIGLIRKMAGTGKPLIMSTGMATLDEIDEAVSAARGAGATALALLRTNSGYPAAPGEMDLRSIETLRDRFGTVVGLSDHTHGTAVPVAAVSLGARIVEKHFTLSRDEPGPDSAFSLEPAEFKTMVDAVRVAEQALGGIRFGPSAREQSSKTFRRSLFIVKDIPAGEVLTDQHVRSIRPGAGLHTRFLPAVLGWRAREAIARGTPLSWSHLDRFEPGAQGPADATLPSVGLRAARADDCSLVYEWATEPFVRRMSFSTGDIAFDDHERWFAAKLADPACAYFIATDAVGEPLGQVRFDRLEAGDGVISMLVAPAHRGRGVGATAIAAASAKVLQSGHTGRILAYIKPVNVASIRAFARAGYSAPVETNYDGHPALLMTRTPA